MTTHRAKRFVAFVALVILLSGCSGDYDYDASIQKAPTPQPSVDYCWNGRDFVPCP